jgi:hypothetical protein
MTLDSVIKLLRRRCTDAGSQLAAARELEVSPAYLCDVLARRREPGEKILRPLGLSRRVSYEPMRAATNGHS